MDIESKVRGKLEKHYGCFYFCPGMTGRGQAVVMCESLFRKWFKGLPRMVMEDSLDVEITIRVLDKGKTKCRVK